MALTDNIVAYWKLDESSGNASDATGNGYTLTNENTVTYDGGLINNGMDTGSSGSRRVLTTANNLGIDGGPITMSVWINRNSLSSTALALMVCASVTSQVFYHIAYSTSTGVKFGRWQIPSSDILTSGSSQLGSSNWNHLVLTYDGTTLGGYINNVAVTGVLTSGNGTAGGVSDTSLGGDDQIGETFRGKLDEAGIWSRALSSDEVNTLYNGGTGLQYPFSVTPPATNNASFFLNFC